MAKVLYLSALIALNLSACDCGTKKSVHGRPSLVLVTMDTTRADRIGAYGYKAAMTPNIDEFASQGALFSRAYCTVPLTIPAHASMMTGLYPTRHGVMNNGDNLLGDQYDTLAELLKARGYKTGASVSAFVTTRIWNLDQGFDLYADKVRSSTKNPMNRWKQERPASDVVDDALDFLGTVGDDPFFLWAHFYDPHDPYKPPAPFSQAFANKPYDGEIAYMDQEIGRLRDAVSKSGNPDGIAWILVGDHGEAIEGEHGEKTHGVFLFDPTTHVPFIAVPAKSSRKAPLVVEQTVSNVDVMPTALGLLGIESNKDLDGVDLSGLLRGEKLERPPIFMAAWDVAQRFGYHPEFAAVEGSLKLIDTPNGRLFDIKKDPQEQRNLIDENVEARKRLHDVVEKSVSRIAELHVASAGPDVSQQLAALGYVEPAFDINVKSDIDAKDKQDVISDLEHIRANTRGQWTARQVEDAYKALIEREPSFVEARLGLARALEQQGRFTDALEVYRVALDKQPASTVLRSSYANCLAMARQFEQGIAEARKVLEQMPTDTTARSGLLRMLSESGRPDLAIAQAKKWLEESPNDHLVQAQLGIEYAHARDYALAEPLLLASLADGEPRLFVHRFLGQITMDRGEFQVAVNHFYEELEYFPLRVETHAEIGSAYMFMEKWDDAAAEFRLLVELQPENHRARYLSAQCIFNGGDYTLAQEILAPALAAVPVDPDMTLLQANILAKLGRREEGKVLFERAKALDADRKKKMAEAAELQGVR